MNASTSASRENRDLRNNRAVQLVRMGKMGAIAVSDLDPPSPSSDEVVIRVAAASVNPVDWKIRDGETPFVEEKDLPVPMGRDCAGTIELMGPDAPAMTRDGQRVMAHLGDFTRGGQARFVEAKANEFIAIPDTVSDVDAAAVGLVGMTAYQGLFDHGHLEKGQSVLIHGAAGGVGHIAVQLARIKGAIVYATCSAKDVEYVKSLGASKAIDYEAQDFTEEVGEVDLVLDLIGGKVQERSLSVIKDNGTMITTLSENDTAEAPRGIRVKSYMAHPDTSQLNEILGYMAEGRVTVAVAETFPLDDAEAAYKRDKHGHDRGKIILVNT